MRLDFEDNVVLVVEVDHAGIVAKDAHTPVVRPGLLADLLSGGENRLAEHVVELPLLPVVAITNASGERLVAAMLAPGLGDGFQFNIGRIAADGLELGLNRLHFDQREIQLALQAETLQSRVVHRPERHGPQAKLVRRAHVQAAKRKRPDNHLLDGVVGQNLRGQQSSRSAGRPPIQYFFSVRTASARMPKSAMADSTLWATGSITPGFRRTWTNWTLPGASFGRCMPASGSAGGSIKAASPTAATTVCSTTRSVSSSRAMRWTWSWSSGP